MFLFFVGVDRCYSSFGVILEFLNHFDYLLGKRSKLPLFNVVDAFMDYVACLIWFDIGSLACRVSVVFDVEYFLFLVEIGVELRN